MTHDDVGLRVFDRVNEPTHDPGHRLKHRGIGKETRAELPALQTIRKRNHRNGRSAETVDEESSFHKLTREQMLHGILLFQQLIERLLECRFAEVVVRQA